VDSLGVPAPELLECPLWLARYPFKTRIAPIIHPTQVNAIALPPVPKSWIDASNVWIHQYQGDALGFPGCSGAVDLNRFFDLCEGSKGERVRWLQRILGISVDGQFGPLTRGAVIRFQKEHQLIPDGIVGPKTFAQLCWANRADAREFIVGSRRERGPGRGEAARAPQAAGGLDALWLSIRAHGRTLVTGLAAAAAFIVVARFVEARLARRDR